MHVYYIYIDACKNALANVISVSPGTINNLPSHAAQTSEGPTLVRQTLKRQFTDQSIEYLLSYAKKTGPNMCFHGFKPPGVGQLPTYATYACMHRTPITSGRILCSYEHYFLRSPRTGTNLTSA
jgi:hypothetical protein